MKHYKMIVTFDSEDISLDRILKSLDPAITRIEVDMSKEIELNLHRMNIEGHNVDVELKQVEKD